MKKDGKEVKKMPADKEKDKAKNKEEEKKVSEEKAEEVTGETTEEAAAEEQESAEDPKEEAEQESEAEAAEEKAPKKEKKGLFGKAKDNEKEKLKEQVSELNDRLLRQMAEFENFRKRSDKEKNSMYENGAKSVIEKLLPIVDNFERGMGTLTDEDKETAFAKGMEMIYKQLMDELDKMDVKPIDAAGKEFDPNLHNAVMHVDDDSLGENVVVEELQKGYTYRGNVVRHSMVKVAN
ncbi:MAG: nucleotide exchange factor GrpE [Lachnospiraceae bacterium]|nr:nucleotide exchange factor GrpE [Lachnospiraceae bacterium]